jgi:hypothetical protein
VGDLTQVLERVLLGGHRIGLGVAHPAHDLDVVGLDLRGLALALRLDEGAGDRHRAAGREADDLAVVIGQGGPGHDLDGVEARAVVDGEEAEPTAGFGLSAVADPALDRRRRADGNPPAQRVDHAPARGRFPRNC